MVVGVGLVELEHGELGIVLRRDAFIAEVAVDLIHALQAAYHQPLEIQLRRNAQVEIDVERIVVRFKRTRRGPAGDGLHHGRFHFDITARIQKTPDRLHHFAAFDKNITHVLIHDQVHVALAIAQLHVLQAVPFFRQGQQVFTKEGELFRVDGQLAGARAEKISGHANVVAQVKQLVQGKTFFPHEVELHVNLQTLAALLQMGEPGFAL